MSSRLALAALAVVSFSCIERPDTARSRAADIDRSKLSGVVLSSTPAPQVAVGAVFGDALELVGYDVAPDPAPKGGLLTVTFYWRVLDEVNDDWKVFVHIDDEAHEATRVLGDHWPAEDRYRTVAWRKGEIVKDTWRFSAPAGAVEHVELWTGFFIDDLRLPLTKPGKGTSDGQNRVRIGSIALH